jgi:hypothetical protein
VPQHQDPSFAVRRSRPTRTSTLPPLQHARKISGFRAPAAHNAAAFDKAVEAVAAAARQLLDRLEIRGVSSTGSRAG